MLIYELFFKYYHNFNQIKKNINLNYVKIFNIILNYGFIKEDFQLTTFLKIKK